MPFGDWQFYVVSVAGLIALWVLARTIIGPFMRKRARPTKTTLTISGRPLSRR